MIIIRTDEVKKIIGLSRTTIWRLENDKDLNFPKRIQLTKNSVGWNKQEILDWVESRPRGSVSPPVCNKHQQAQAKV